MEQLSVGRVISKFNPIKYFLTSGCIAPSSSFLIHKMLSEIDFQSVDIIVELGGGNGCMTKEILKQLKPEGKLLCFEINNEFCKMIHASIKDKRLVLIQKSAEQITEELHLLGIEKVDCVVSSLPLVFIARKNINRILTQVKKLLAPHGVLLQYQYSLANYTDMKRYFNQVIKGIEFRNLPPAVIYHCVNK